MSASGTKLDIVPRPSLDGIPKETFKMVLDHLDKTSHIRLARVCHSLHQRVTPFLDDVVWKSLDINYPGIAEDHDLDSALHRLAREDPVAADRAVVACHQGFGEMVSNLWESATKKKLGRVISLKFSSGKGSEYTLRLILRKVAPTLIKLEIVGIPRYLTRFPSPRSVVDIGSLFDYPSVSFPSLNTPRLGNGTGLTALLVKLLFNMPQLSTLDLDLRSSTVTHPSVLSLAGDARLLMLRKLNIKWEYAYDDDDDDFDYRESTNDLQMLGIIEIMQRSPGLEQLGLILSSQASELHHREIPRTAARLANLHDIYSCSEYQVFANNHPQGTQADIASSSMKRIVLHTYSWRSMFDHELLHNPNIAIVHLISPRFRKVPFPLTAPVSLSAQYMFIGLTKTIRLCPNLRVINCIREAIDDSSLDFFGRLDQIELSGQVWGRISSMTHRGQELVIAHCLHDFVDEEDEDHRDDADDHNFSDEGTEREVVGEAKYVKSHNGKLHWHDPKDYVRRYRQRETLIENAGAGIERRRNFKQTTVFTWQVYTDYDNFTVPLEVIKEMRELEGEIEDWERRGVEVGEAAWKVLMDFVASQA